MTRFLREMVLVKVSVVGMADESLGTYLAEVDMDTMDERQVGRALASAYRRALGEALRDFTPKLGAKWQSEPDRMRDGDE